MSDINVSNVSASGRPIAWLLGIMVAEVVLAIAALAANLYVACENPWTLSVSIERAATEISPQTEILITTNGLGGEIVGVELHETTMTGGDRVAERWNPVHLLPAGEVALPQNQSRSRLVQPDGTSPLRYDSRYSLHLTTKIGAPLFPLPSDHEVTRELAFRTLTSPRLLPYTAVIESNTARSNPWR